MLTPYEMTNTTVALGLSPKRLGWIQQLCALAREYILQKLGKKKTGLFK